MTAAFSVYLDTAGTADNPATSTDVDTGDLAGTPPNIRFKRADDHNIDANNPMTIPSSGTNYSRWKSIYLYCDTAPSSQVDNIKFYTDGTGFGTGITMNIGDETPVKNSGASTGYDVSDTDDEHMTNHADITAVTDAFTYTSGNMKTVSISESGNLINAIGETSNYIVLQLAVADTASPGDLTDETCTFQINWVYPIEETMTRFDLSLCVGFIW